MEHRFGGIWTQKKLTLLGNYLGFYTKALKWQPFTLHYADAFAGTGTQNKKIDVAQQDFLPEEDFHGSVRVALEVNPPFSTYHFNDTNPGHVRALEALRTEFPDRDIRITREDANEFVPSFCRNLGQRDRAVMLLDPYSTELDWQTLRHVAASQKVDLWLLFPISAILRMTPRREDRIREEWRATISRLLGNDGWQDALYRPVETPTVDDLFGDHMAADAERLNIDELERWVTGRLREVFSYVADPVRLTNQKSTLFLFYFAVSNPSETAQHLAARVVKDLSKTQARGQLG